MNVEEVVRMLCFGRDMVDFFLPTEMEGWEKSLGWCSAGVEGGTSGLATSGEVKLSSGVSLDDMLLSSRSGRSLRNASLSFSLSLSLSFLRSFVRLAPRNRAIPGEVGCFGGKRIVIVDNRVW